MIKEDIISRIGQDKWWLFEVYMSSRDVYFKGNELHYPEDDVLKFLKNMGRK